MSFDPWKEWSVRVVRLRSGQPRPYADSEYEAELHYSFANGEGRPSEELVKRHFSALVREFHEPQKTWAHPVLKSIQKIGPLSWRILVIEPYTD